jgi:hypothetical protein
MTTPTNKAPGFLICLKAECESAPEALKKIVDKSIEIKNFAEMLQFYEVRNPNLANAVLASIVRAVSEKMEYDVQAHQVGATTFTSIVTQAVAFGIIAGVHLSKEREL